MDSSAAPWRVLESAASAVDGEVGSEVPPGSGPRNLSVSPLTAAAMVGAVLLAAAAFLLASAGAGAGVVQVQGGGSLASIPGAFESAQTDNSGGLTGTSANVIVVEVTGAVRDPGVFRLPIGSRVGDLIEVAGGYGPRLDAQRASHELNLAARLTDGDRIMVPSRDDVAASTSGAAGGSGSSGAQPSATLVDLNRATSAELEALPGIGPVTAGKIIASRDELAFTTVDDLRSRKLVGAKTFEALRDLVAVP